MISVRCKFCLFADNLHKFPKIILACHHIGVLKIMLSGSYDAGSVLVFAAETHILGSVSECTFRSWQLDHWGFLQWF